MKTINVYDYEEERIQKICDDNDITEPELIEMFFDYWEEVKENNGLV